MHITRISFYRLIYVLLPYFDTKKRYYLLEYGRRKNYYAECMIIIFPDIQYFYLPQS